VKVKVAKNLKGTLIVSAISHAPMRKNEEHTITVEQYWHPAVQEAVKQKLLTVTDGAPKAKDVVQVYKTCVGSVALPVVKKILRDSTPFSVPAELLDHRDFKLLLRNHKIDVLTGRKKLPETQPEPESAKKPVKGKKQTDAVVWDARAKADEELADAEAEAEKPKTKTVKRAQPKLKPQKKGDNSLIIDTDSEEDDSVEMQDSIQWVDGDETAKRIAAHPILSKKKGYKG
jgi:hypothetical protein